MAELTLSMCHHVFLGSEDRRRLAAGPAEVSAVGSCLPVWSRGYVSDEPAEEMFCRYTMRSYHPDPDKPPVEVKADGFQLALPNQAAWLRATDMADGGSEYLRLGWRSVEKAGEREFLVDHVFVIQPAESGEVWGG